ncbi:MAG: Rrf2 family transcriptional regulator [candidate division KSB1 bacterium]|nr:Rrf2 family transcriptional regulator [candidate division KSB1 bacterium]MDQ7066169.1 Rrf2 family transcriptional regulator [candidate division KSB1 bacterium]
MYLTQKSIYAIQALIYIALHDHGKFVPTREISKRLDIPFSFLTKILQVLSKQQILETYRGPTGGVRLLKRPTQISIEQIILSIDGDRLFTQCILRLPDCGNSKPCPLHDLFAPIRENLRDMLSHTMLSLLVKLVRENQAKLTSISNVNDLLRLKQ